MMHRRKRKSMFDDYKDEIVDCLSQGMYVRDIAKIISEHFGYEICNESLYHYIKANNLKLNEVNKDVPHCEKCNKCGRVMDFSGRNVYRVCEADRRIVSRTVHTSPSWCPKRQEVSA